MADSLNISPEMIDNLVNMLKSNNNFSFHDGSKERNTVSSQDNSNNTDNSSSVNNLDFDTIMKIKSIMESLNSSNDNDSKLLYSLKPYLRKSRQKKIDQYINILKISQVSKLFNQKGDVD